MAFRARQEIILARSFSSITIVSGTSEDTIHSISFECASPLELRVRTSIFSPKSVSSAIAESGRPPTLSASLMTNWITSRMFVQRSPGVGDCSEVNMGDMADSQRLSVAP
jgi:hypothetical protein